ncbi:MAG TPA: DUF1743 domain-containing protein [Methanosarcinales archaeon]|nr:DUF1743 domain-containing protein [Methanosarcinales archaeon]
MIIGIDDTDSVDGMCTTYLTAILIDKLKDLGDIRGLPHLIRLNPNIKYKTRGNAALAVEIDTDTDSEEQIVSTAISLVQDMADMDCENTNPGIVFLINQGRNDPEFRQDLERFMWQAMRDVLAVEDARSLIGKYGIKHKGFKNGRGLIGALAACGSVLCGLPDHTYELIAYRNPGKFGTPREIDRESVFRADRETYPGTWDTVDISNDTIVFAPHSPDPVLFGIRGDDVQSIEKAFDIIGSEPVGLTLLYRTNQGTDFHLLDAQISDVLEERSYKLTGTVADRPETIRGGHMFFTLKGSGIIRCAAFEPTKGFRNIIKELIPGDKVSVYGGIANGTLNVEKIGILELAAYENTSNPLCPTCGKRMKSAGSGQGFRCKGCNTKSDEVVRTPVDRCIRPGIYEVPPCARRHISKPLVRSAEPGVYPSR